MKRDSDRLGVKIVGGLKEVSTPWSGVLLLVDLFRKIELEQLATKAVLFLLNPGL